MQKRYKQEYFSYDNTALVVCPHCGEDALVKNENNDKQASLECRHCSLRKTGNELVVYKAFIKLHCPACAHPIRYEQGKLKEKPKNIPVRCDECDASFQVRPKTEKYMDSYAKETGLIHDPVFGCPYYFQEDFKGKLFWARNREHLLEMENYISSGLRTRLPYRMYMVERLPTFIKESKNREALLKILQKWKNSYK
jgi:transcription elongation factor Elf1